MSAPSKAYQFLPVKVWSGQRLTTSPALNLTYCSGNSQYEAEGQEVSGCNASEGIEHRNNLRVGGRYFSLSSRQYFHNCYGEIMKTRRCLRPQQDTIRS